MNADIVPEKKPHLKPEELSGVSYNGAPVTRELLEAKPDLIGTIECFTGIILDMARPEDGDVPEVTTP